MKYKKNILLSFIFGCIPGAGPMYMGATKKGTVILTLFSAISVFSAVLGINVIVFLLPVIWFYSFFDTFNLRNLPYEEVKQDEKEFLSSFGKLFGKDYSMLVNGKEKFWGVILIILGIYTLLSFFSFILNSIGLYFLSPIFRVIPNLLLAFILFYFGIKLVKKSNTKKYYKDDEDVSYYKSNDCNDCENTVVTEIYEDNSSDDENTEEKEN